MKALPDAQRAAARKAWMQQFPDIAEDTPFADKVRQSVPPAERAVKSVDVQVFLARLGMGRAGHRDAGSLERVGALLETFAQAFVELRKGHEQFGEHMAVALAPDNTPLARAKDAKAVLTCLLDDSQDGLGAVDALRRAFTDLALHQVALLSGVMEGARAMLDEVSPNKLTGRPASRALARGGVAGWLERVFSWRKAAAWSAFVGAYEELLEDDSFTRPLFGRRFARAYLMVAGGAGGSPSSGGAGTASDAAGKPPAPSVGGAAAASTA